MLTQRKDNERGRFLEEAIEGLNKSISSIAEKVKTLEYYQKENFREYQRI
jgi:DNA-binding ferritin-like protein